jgi:hypothetical protein
MIKLTCCLHRLPHLTRVAGHMLLEDERRFIGLACFPLWWGEEKPVVG